MCAYRQDQKPPLIPSLLNNKCTRCRRGDLFKYKGAFRIKGLMTMNDKCPVCGQPLDMEPGFYYGTIMISYAIAVLFSVVTFVLWWAIIGMSLHDSRFFWWIGVNAVLLGILQPPLMRISRTVWLSFFVRYSPNWYKGDIVNRYNYNKDQMENW
ncbi:DUF983 domain-containing protein [Flaviaesturariibacter aridisoli]|uniref:DUF983 domain-containing protein n=1 Tax=Flaviaesturariibacter aridisoli TaxID=2545761 RepID=A0A4R4E8S3_9BACT|nr:DUF983 domain-containing protein [Flaviaesturariibacter aridisoli]TCZ74208.1 DUF983 domain-containing protein [Flaviaesturariibacter aridisoli]